MAHGAPAAMWRSVESPAGGGPGARCKHAAARLAGWLWVVGGRGAGGALPLRDHWRYCLASGRWERLPARGECPPALQEHSAVPHGDCLYVFGGEVGAGPGDTPLWALHCQTLEWRKIPPPRCASGRGCRGGRAALSAPAPRRGHSAHALADCMLVFGGYRDLRGSSNELWAFHYESEWWQLVRTTGAPARHGHAAALLRDTLYVHGGRHDLRECGDLWAYDTMTRAWRQVRGASRGGPGARTGHAALRAGPHFYIFGGEVRGAFTNELWRFHLGTETWERIAQTVSWPSPRAHCAVLLLSHAPPCVSHAPDPSAPPTALSARPEPPQSLLREISKLSSFHLRRAARCSYSALPTEPTSSESLAAAPTAPALPRSRSSGGGAPREADEADEAGELAREPVSVPDFADVVLPTPVLSPVEATKLVYFDSEEEEEMRRETEREPPAGGVPGVDTERYTVVMPKSASVRFTSVTPGDGDGEGDMSTSDYASAERVNRLSLGFCNPHYLGPDVRALGAALTPDSGLGAGAMELKELGTTRGGGSGRGDELHLLVVGGREAARPNLQPRTLSMWTYRLL